VARIGMNPARDRVSEYRPARVTVAILVYVPYLSGYFQQRLEVLKVSLASLFKHTNPPYDLLIFDNGSCREVKSYLQALFEAGRIDYLVSSKENIGKIGAFRVMFGAVPGELIAYADDDIFYYPGWLEAHLEIVDRFPRVGMVSGCALRTLYDHGISSNLAFTEQNPSVRVIHGQNIPQKWEVDWAVSYGRDVDAHLERLERMEDIQFELDGLTVYAVANHNQFVAPKGVMRQSLPEEWSGRLMGQMDELDVAVDEGGYLRLSTLERTTRHIGNLIDANMLDELKDYSISISMKPAPRTTSTGSWSRTLLRWRPVRWFLQGIYNRLFWLLSGERGKWRGDGSSTQI
jgi:glycosyltransferase involved in cell wall biosynthesis